jgi:polysaccharide deacetylase family protein (PEP-CTERM system associated)
MPAGVDEHEGKQGPRHLLTFDVEEYFQVQAAAACVDRDQWDHRPRRLDEPMDLILRLLEDHQTRATFFILGWVARKEPDLVRRIAEAGHEVASHGMSHRMVNELSPESFRAELDDSRKLLSDLAGRDVLGFRAPTFSVTHRTAWAVDVLAEAGYRYDSSVFPVTHDRYGVPEAPPGPHQAVGPSNRRLLEIPPLTLRMLGRNWPAAGGGYMRLLPVGVMGLALSRVAAAGRPGMVYLHPWELDPHQPVLPMGRLGTWRHRVGLAKTADKLRWLVRRFRFGPVVDQLDALNDLAGGSQFTYGRDTTVGA